MSFSNLLGLQAERWENPTESLGSFIGFLKVGHLRYRCWEATGKARIAFQQLSPQIQECLGASNIPPSSDNVTWSIYMIGHTEVTASPRILICSTEAKTRKNIRKLIKDSKIMNKHPGIGLGDVSALPDRQSVRLLAIESILALLPSGHDVQGAVLAGANSGPELGVRLWAVHADDYSCSLRPITGGPFVSLGDTTYQLTIAHAFADDKQPADKPADNADLDCDLDGMSEGGLEDDEETVMMLQTGSVTSDDMDSDINSFVTERMAASISGSSSPPREITPEGDGRGSVGSIGLSQVQQELPVTPNLSELRYYGKLVHTSLDGDKPSLDYALIEFDSDFILRQVNRLPAIDKDLSLGPVEGNDTKIVAISPRFGTISGDLTATPSYIRTPGQTKFQTIYPVRLNLPVADGDCGTAIVDKATGRFYGQIIAGGPGTRVAYMVPASEIAEDIEQRFGKTLHFPGTTRKASDTIHQIVPSEKGREVIAPNDTSMRSGSIERIELRSRDAYPDPRKDDKSWLSKESQEACEDCQMRRIKCDAAITGGEPCSACIRSKLYCVRADRFKSTAMSDSSSKVSRSKAVETPSVQENSQPSSKSSPQFEGIPDASTLKKFSGSRVTSKSRVLPPPTTDTPFVAGPQRRGVTSSNDKILTSQSTPPHPPHAILPGHFVAGPQPLLSTVPPPPPMSHMMPPVQPGGPLPGLQASQRPPGMSYPDLRRGLITDGEIRDEISDYCVFRFEKATGNQINNEKNKISWKNVVRTQVTNMSKSEIVIHIRRLDRETKNVREKKSSLTPDQQRQLEKALEELVVAERDPRFRYELVQIDQQLRLNHQKASQLRRTRSSTASSQRSEKKTYSTVSLTGYYRRSPKLDANAGLFLLERDMLRMPPPPMPPPPPSRSMLQPSTPWVPPPPPSRPLEVPSSNQTVNFRTPTHVSLRRAATYQDGVSARRGENRDKQVRNRFAPSSSSGSDFDDYGMWSDDDNSHSTHTESTSSHKGRSGDDPGGLYRRRSQRRPSGFADVHPLPPIQRPVGYGPSMADIDAIRAEAYAAGRAEERAERRSRDGVIRSSRPIDLSRPRDGMSRSILVMPAGERRAIQYVNQAARRDAFDLPERMDDDPMRRRYSVVDDEMLSDARRYREALRPQEYDRQRNWDEDLGPNRRRSTMADESRNYSRRPYRGYDGTSLESRREMGSRADIEFLERPDSLSDALNSPLWREVRGGERDHAY